MRTFVNKVQSPRWLAIFFIPILFAALCFYAINLVQSTFEPIRNRNIALLIAHPDDEAMFFSPTLQSITNPSFGNTVQVICFSSGDADGIGETRKRELVDSCRLLGVPSPESAVTIHEHSSLPDSMSVRWPEDVISSLLAETLSSTPLTVDTLITFDRNGVSSHPNHISLLAGAKHFISTAPHQQAVLLYTLTSVPIYRKYASILDLLTTVLSRWKGASTQYGGVGSPQNVVYISNWNGYRLAQKAMVEGHKSQMRWFRWGWITLSRYMVTNDLMLDNNTSV